MKKRIKACDSTLNIKYLIFGIKLLFYIDIFFIESINKSLTELKRFKKYLKVSKVW